MPTYLYRTIREDGSEGELFECTHPMSETLRVHPETGVPVKRVYSAPNLGTKHTAGRTKSMLSNENLDRKGFTKYERDKVSGKYHKVVGDGPSVINRPPSV